MKMESKKRFIREKLGISTKGLTTKDINSFFKKLEELKCKENRRK